MCNNIENSISNSKTPFVIAEIGTSHNGDIIKAKELVDAAKFAKASCVKFQYVIADEIVSKKAGFIDLPGGKTDIYNSFKKLEVDYSFYKELKDYCDKIGIHFLCSPFGVTSLYNLEKISVDTLKIASPELSHFQMLEKINKDIFLILSTGVTKISDLNYTINFIKNRFALLHCVTHYPASIEEYNLNSIPYLSKKYSCLVGVSDHTSNYEIIPLLSKYVGGRIIEKHITLDNKSSGLDDSFALEINAFKQMCDNLINIDNNSIIEYLLKKYSLNLNKILGTYNKKLTKFEKSIYKTTNRSIIVTETINKGELFTEKNIALLRSEKNIKPGTSAKYYKHILNKKCNKTLQEGTSLTLKDICLF